MSEIQDAMRSMQAGKHMGKVVIEPKEDDVVLVRRTKRALHDSGLLTYLLGSSTNYAYLITEAQEASSAVQMLIEEVANLKVGAKVLVTKCDIRNREQVTSLANAYNETTPIRGIIHATMVVRDTLFERLTWDIWMDVTEPRVQGAWNLHYCFPKLDFVVMLSSVTSFYGNHGQAAYAASNSFLDAFAAYRRLQGLPAATIDLCIVEDVGYIAEADPERQTQFEAQAHDKIQEHEMHSSLKAVILPKAGRMRLPANHNRLEALPQLETSLVGFRAQSLSHLTRIEFPNDQEESELTDGAAREAPQGGLVHRGGEPSRVRSHCPQNLAGHHDAAGDHRTRPTAADVRAGFFDRGRTAQLDGQRVGCYGSAAGADEQSVHRRVGSDCCFTVVVCQRGFFLQERERQDLTVLT